MTTKTDGSATPPFDACDEPRQPDPEARMSSPSGSEAGVLFREDNLIRLWYSAYADSFVG